MLLYQPFFFMKDEAMRHYLLGCTLLAFLGSAPSLAKTTTPRTVQVDGFAHHADETLTLHVGDRIRISFVSRGRPYSIKALQVNSRYFQPDNTPPPTVKSLQPAPAFNQQLVGGSVMSSSEFQYRALRPGATILKFGEQGKQSVASGLPTAGSYLCKVKIIP